MAGTSLENGTARGRSGGSRKQNRENCTRTLQTWGLCCIWGAGSFPRTRRPHQLQGLRDPVLLSSQLSDGGAGPGGRKWRCGRLPAQARLFIQTLLGETPATPSPSAVPALTAGVTRPCSGTWGKPGGGVQVSRKEAPFHAGCPLSQDSLRLNSECGL